MARREDTYYNYGESNAKVRLLPISIILFIILVIFSILIILNKGKIGGYALIKNVNSDVTENQETVKKYDENSKVEISVGKKFLSVKEKETEELKVTIDGEEIDNSRLEFESSNSDTIEVDENGVVKACDVGKATITVKIDKASSSIDLRGIIPITSMSFTTTNSTVGVGRSLQMKLIAKPSDANVETLKYTSSDESIATVNANGIVTGVKPGTVTITVTDLYTEVSKSVKLTIRK